MAKQHFYSCVPAKMSLFAKMDGYDTFAHSAGISRELIENELSYVYANQPTKDDIAQLQLNDIPPVYCQFFTQDKTLVQSCVRFLRSDYTGERSAYSVQSLLLTPEEKAAHLCSPTAAALNPSVFQKQVADFDLTSPHAKPSTDYPETAVPVKDAESTASFPTVYDVGMLKRLIYTLVGIACGKIKALYFSLPSPMETFSEDCLRFINSILQIFPYHVREFLPFVTYVGDPSKYSSFRIKCIPEDAPAIPTSRGITLKMGIKDYVGVNDKNVAVHADMVDFFYGLLTADDVRRAFIEFCRNAVETDETLKKPSFKNLDDLIFLFRYLSGFFSEKSVLPNDDAVYRFVSVYEKNRESVCPAYRERAMNWLHRYSENHTAIPNNVFRKVCSLYPTEPEASRKAVMSTVLELIHEDVMRDKLFRFLRDNYESETESCRKEVMQHICRVYYGGFLQESILEFLSQRFETESKEIRSLILEKLFLTIRTPKAQPGILSFIRSFYDGFSESEKDAFYAMYEEMLPHADTLARALTDIVDEHIDESRREKLTTFLLKAVEKDEKSDHPQLCEVLAVRCGFAERVVAEKVFTDWSGKQIVDTFIRCTVKKPLVGVAETVGEIWSVASAMKKETESKLADALINALKNDTRASVFEWVRAIDRLNETKKKVTASVDFCNRLQQEAMLPALSVALGSVFDRKRYPNGIADITELSLERPYLAKAPAFSQVEAYNQTLCKLQEGHFAEAMAFAEQITGESARVGAATRFVKDLSEHLPKDSRFYAELVVEYWKTNRLAVSDAAAVLREARMQDIPAASDKKAAKEQATSMDEELMQFVLKSCGILYAAVSEELRESMVAPDGQWAEYVTAFLSKYQRKGRKQYEEWVSSLNMNKNYCIAAQDVLARFEKQLGFFGKLF